MKLKIQRINKTKFLVKEGKRIVRQCASFKEAYNFIMKEDLNNINNISELRLNEILYQDIIQSYEEVA